MIAAWAAAFVSFLVVVAAVVVVVAFVSFLAAVAAVIDEGIHHCPL